MILVNTVPNSKGVAPKLQKLQSRKVPINVGRTTSNNKRHQPGKTFSLVEMKFRRDKNQTEQNTKLNDTDLLPLGSSCSEFGGELTHLETDRGIPSSQVK